MTPPAEPLFVDTSAWVALTHRRDQAHARAAHIWPTVRASRRRLVTTNLVAAETYNLLARRIGVDAALAFLDRLLFQRHHSVIWTDAELTHAAVEGWLRPYRGQALSLTDAVSFEVMRREGIQEAFGFDQDFERVGFVLI